MALEFIPYIKMTISGRVEFQDHTQQDEWVVGVTIVRN